MPFKSSIEARHFTSPTLSVRFSLTGLHKHTFAPFITWINELVYLLLSPVTWGPLVRAKQHSLSDPLTALARARPFESCCRGFLHRLPTHSFSLSPHITPHHSGSQSGSHPIWGHMLYLFSQAESHFIRQDIHSLICGFFFS